METWTEDAAELDGKGNLLMKICEKDSDYYTSQLQTGSNFMDRPADSKFSKRLKWPIGKLVPPKFVHKYGYYEIRCKLPTQPGWWAAFWLQSPCNGASLDPRDSGVEIDIMENFSRDGTVNHALHWNGCGADLQSKAGWAYHPSKRTDLFKPGALQGGYHTYGVDWSRKGYVFYVDGKETWRVDGPVSDREQFILVTAECMGYRNGKPTTVLKKAKLPDYFIVDYVRVFDEITDTPGS